MTINLVGIKCQESYYITELNDSKYNPHTNPINYIINGVSPERTFHENWCKIKNEPTRVQKFGKTRQVNHRYILVDTSLESDKIPSVLSTDDIVTDEYKTLKSLYKLVYDTIEPKLEDVKFTYNTVMVVDKVPSPSGMSFTVQRGKWKSEGYTEITAENIQHSILDKMIYPDIMLPARPCKLTKKDSYKIVREYIRRNINHDVAKITSDYNFCLTVKKIVPLAEPYEFTVDANAFKKTKRKKLVEKKATNKEITVYRVAPEPYQTYPVIKDFQAESEEALNTLITDYCEAVVAHINKPLKECDKCSGLGHLFKGEKAE